MLINFGSSIGLRTKVFFFFFFLDWQSYRVTGHNNKRKKNLLCSIIQDILKMLLFLQGKAFFAYLPPLVLFFLLLMDTSPLNLGGAGGVIRLYILKNSQKQKLKLGRTCSDDITGVFQDLCPFIYVIYHWLPGTWQTSGLEQLLLKTIRIQWWTLQVNHLGYVPTHLKKNTNMQVEMPLTQNYLTDWESSLTFWLLLRGYASIRTCFQMLLNELWKTDRLRH